MKLYAIRYAVDFKYGKMGHFFRGAPNAEKRIADFPFFYYLAQVESKNYLIDTGFRDQETDVVMSRKAYEMARKNGTVGVKRRLRGDAVTLVDDELLIDGKFLFRVIGGHTPDSSVVFFEEAGEQYVITGDECYQIENILRNIPIGITSDAAKNEQFIASIHGTDITPLPFHDVSILAKYRRVSENVVQVIGD